MIGETFTSLPLGQIFAQRKEQGRECLPVYAVTMQGLINRREFARRVESDLSSNRHALVCEGDVVYNTMRLWQGVADVASEDCNVSPAYIVCKPRVPVWPRYFAHAFKTPEMVAKFKSKSEGVASDRFRLYFHQFAKIELNLPPLQEQRRIAEILDTVDEALRKTEQVIAKLEQVKAGLLHDLLTRGIDENGELRDPEKRPQDFKESELGLIPKGWEVEPLRAVTLRVDYGVSVPLHDSGEVPVLRMNNFSAGEATIDDLRFSDSPKAKNLLLRDGDVLFNRTNSIEHVGRTGIWRGQLPIASFASYLVRIVPDCQHVSSEFLNLWLNLPRTKTKVKRWATPAIQQVNINPTNLKRTPIAFPSNSAEQLAIVRVYNAQSLRVTAALESLTKLKLIKQGLADDLLTGRVRSS